LASPSSGEIISDAARPNLFVVHCLPFLTQRIDSIFSSDNACAEKICGLLVPFF
jgi:hypothetical protein